MAKDPAFLFYPGDYLRDTQVLSESVQVAYDRIMCEHMRNICISQQQLNFLTKKLSPDEKIELLTVLTKISGGFQISWVAESISKRKAYGESRRKNRVGKTKEHINNTSSSYVEHMEIENETVIEDEERKRVWEKTEKVQEVAKKLERFIKPTTADIISYLLSEGITPQPIEADKFIDFYSSKDWMVGKNKMKDWKAAVRNWFRNIIQTQQTKNGITPKNGRAKPGTPEFNRELAELIHRDYPGGAGN